MPLRKEWDMMVFTGSKSAGVKLVCRYAYTLITTNTIFSPVPSVQRFWLFFLTYSFVFHRENLRSAVTSSLDVITIQLHGPGLKRLLFMFYCLGLTLCVLILQWRTWRSSKTFASRSRACASNRPVWENRNSIMGFWCKFNFSIRTVWSLIRY